MEKSLNERLEELGRKLEMSMNQSHVRINRSFAIVEYLDKIVLYIAPLYAGDHYHEAIIDRLTKVDMLERKVLEFKPTVHLGDELSLLFYGGADGDDNKYFHFLNGKFEMGYYPTKLDDPSDEEYYLTGW